MRKTRLLSGIALIVAGTAVGVLGVRSVLGDQARAQAALLRSATGESDARGAPEKKSAEKQVWEAARLEPLEAALRARVDGPTLVDSVRERRLVAPLPGRVSGGARARRRQDHREPWAGRGAGR